MPKQVTVRFYTDSRRYKGWQYLLNTTYMELRSWCLSGNYVLIEKAVFNSFNYTKLITGVYRKLLK